MKHFYDLEFLERCEPGEHSGSIDLISIGIVSDDGAEYYAINSDIQTDRTLHERVSQHDWLCKNVIMHLPLIDDAQVAKQLKTAEMSRNPRYFGPTEAGWGKPRELDWELDLTDRDVKPRWVIANEIREYFLNRLDHGMHDPEMDDEGDVELWANYGAYDHVRLMWLWGPMIARPKHLPMFTHDIQQLRRSLRVPYGDMPKQESAKHDALADARHNQQMWNYLNRVSDDLAQRRGF
jgi:3' exoribonuclease, RNase T-like